MIKYIVLLNLLYQILEITKFRITNSVFKTAHTEYNEEVVKTILKKLKTCEDVLNKTFVDLPNSNEFQTLKSLIIDAVELCQECIENECCISHTNRRLKLKINKITKNVSELTTRIERYFNLSQPAVLAENLPYKPFNKVDDVTKLLNSKIDKNLVQGDYLIHLKKTCDILSREPSSLQELSANLLEALSQLIVIREKTVDEVERELAKFTYEVVNLHRTINPNTGFDNCIKQVDLSVVGGQAFVRSSKLVETYNNGKSGISAFCLSGAKRELKLLEKHSKLFVDQLETCLGITQKTYDPSTFLVPIAVGSSSSRISINSLLNQNDNSFTAHSPSELLPSSNSSNSSLKNDSINKDKPSFSEEGESLIDFE